MKTRIFIGSSREGLNEAYYVKSKFQDAGFEVFVWNDDIFKANKNTLETLLNAAGIFDFGIMIATKDDFTHSREQSFDTARDNVLFEFGLFLGRLGDNRAFVLQEEGVKLPSDLLGITIPRFMKAKDYTYEIGFNRDIEDIINIIKEKLELGELGLLPSTVLAIGYYENFVFPVCEALQKMQSIELNSKLYKDFKFNIVIPKDLDSNIRTRAAVYFKNMKMQEVKIDVFGRSFPLYLQMDEESSINKAVLYDMPTTLGGIDKAIELFMRKGHIGKTKQQDLLEERELRNFTCTLLNLIKQDAITRENVFIIEE